MGRTHAARYSAENTGLEASIFDNTPERPSISFPGKEPWFSGADKAEIGGEKVHPKPYTFHLKSDAATRESKGGRRGLWTRELSGFAAHRCRLVNVSAPVACVNCTGTRTVRSGSSGSPQRSHDGILPVDTHADGVQCQ